MPGRIGRCARLALLLPALTVAACDAARTVDAGLRNFDVLDRVFSPAWFRSAPPQVAPPQPPPLVAAPRPGVVLEEPLPPAPWDSAPWASPGGGEPRDPSIAEARLDQPSRWDLQPAPPRAEPARPFEPQRPAEPPRAAEAALSRAEPPRTTEAAPPRAEPSADPALRRRALLRQFPWVAQFWSELDRPQQERVARRLTAAGTPREGHAAAWDTMGLAERVDMLFGSRPSTAAQAPGAGRS